MTRNIAEDRRLLEQLNSYVKDLDKNTWLSGGDGKGRASLGTSHGDMSRIHAIVSLAEYQLPEMVKYYMERVGELEALNSELREALLWLNTAAFNGYVFTDEQRENLKELAVQALNLTPARATRLMRLKDEVMRRAFEGGIHKRDKCSAGCVCWLCRITEALQGIEELDSEGEKGALENGS